VGGGSWAADLGRGGGGEGHGLVHRAPKTQRAKRALEARAPKVVENPKAALFLRGHHTSAVSTGALRDLVRLPTETEAESERGT
jgi:hypothetical protein